MKKSRWIVAALGAVLVAGCAHFAKDARVGLEGFDPIVVSRPNPTKPNVWVLDVDNRKFVVVDQEPIRVGRGNVDSNGRIRISWALERFSAYSFDAEKGIQIVSESKEQPVDDLKCQALGAQRKVFECSYKRPAKRVIFKYTVNVQGLDPLDPYIVNEF